jgi:hypothetical protein
MSPNCRRQHSLHRRTVALQFNHCLVDRFASFESSSLRELPTKQQQIQVRILNQRKGGEHQRAILSGPLVKALTPSHNARWIARNDNARRDVPNNDRTRANDGKISHADVRAHECVGAYPSTPPDRYRALDERQFRSAMVVRSGAEMRSLRDRRLRSDRDPPKTIDLDVVTDRDLILDPKIPWNRDPNRPVNMDLATEMSAKEPQQTAPHTPELAWDKE